MDGLNTRQSERRGLGLGICLAAACVAMFLGGCVGYTAAPKEPNTSIFTDPNAPATRDVAAKAMRWAVYRYPPEGGDGRLTGWDTDASTWEGAPRFVINVPAGTRYEVYERLVRDVGKGAAMVTLNTDTLPTYHLGRVYVMGDMASVDIIRPVAEMGRGPDQLPVYQGMTIQLRGGLKPWQYVSHKTWSMGSMPALTLNYAPDNANGVTAPLQLKPIALPDAVAQPNETHESGAPGDGG